MYDIVSSIASKLPTLRGGFLCVDIQFCEVVAIFPIHPPLLAFDYVDYDKLRRTLLQMGVPKHITRLIKSLYKNQEVAVRTEYDNTDVLQ